MTVRRGEQHGLARLTETGAREVFALRREGLTQKATAARLGCSQQLVSAILRGKAWAHLGLARPERLGRRRSGVGREGVSQVGSGRPRPNNKHPDAHIKHPEGPQRRGYARAAALSPERRQEIARRAALARWARVNGGAA